jgi:hypothetical protein
MCHLTYMFLQHLLSMYMIHHQDPLLLPYINVEPGYDIIVGPLAEANTRVDQHIKERETTQVITSHLHPTFVWINTLKKEKPHK